MNPAERKKLESLPKRAAGFIEPMECALVSELPAGRLWVYEIKLDGYRAVAVKSQGKLTLLSRRGKSFNKQFALIAGDLQDLADNTVIDGEIVGLGETGRPDFNLLQNFREQAARIHYFVFDLLVYNNRDLTRLALIERRALLRSLLSFRSSRIRVVDFTETRAADMLVAIRALNLEGIVAKRKDSLYQAGERTGTWVKLRVNQGQEFVIGGFVPGARGLDSLIVGFYRGDDLIYAARVRSGLAQGLRRALFERLSVLKVRECPFSNLPEKGRSRWGEGLNADGMKQCVWVRPEVVAQVEFLEWTEADHLRHSKFVRLREDKDARSVTKEEAQER